MTLQAKSSLLCGCGCGRTMAEIFDAQAAKAAGIKEAVEKAVRKPVSPFPEDSAERKTYPMYGGLLAYFPSALAKVAHHSYVSNDKHNPNQPMHHDRAKSGDESDALVRHLMEGDYVGMAWRALSLLQKDCEAKGAPIAPAARNANGWVEKPLTLPVGPYDAHPFLNTPNSNTGD